MSELPPPAPHTSAPASSVVLDANASVAVRRWPQYVAILVAAAFAAYFVLSLVVGSDDESYTPGPAALAVEREFERNAPNHTIGVDELRCVDELAADLDTAQLDTAIGGALNGEVDDPELVAFSSALMDDCLQPSSRQAVLVGQMQMDGTLSSEQAACLATIVDEAIVDAGGYAQLYDDPTSVGAATTAAIFSSLETCGVTMADLMGG